MQRSEVYSFVWLNDSQWPKRSQKQIIEALSFINTKKDLRAAKGRGADAMPIPEIEIIITATLSLVAVGFLQALEEDVYKKLKSALVKLRRIRPKFLSQILEYVFLYKQNPRKYKTDIFIHFEFPDYQLRVDFPIFSSNENYQNALDLLPEFIDSCIRKDLNLHIVSWNGSAWEAF